MDSSSMGDSTREFYVNDLDERLEEEGTLRSHSPELDILAMTGIGVPDSTSLPTIQVLVRRFSLPQEAVFHLSPHIVCRLQRLCCADGIVI